MVAEQAMLEPQRGCTVLSYDGVDAYDTAERARMLPALAKHISSVAGYVADLYARAFERLLFRMDDGRTRVVQSRTGVAPTCNPGPLCDSTAMVDLLAEFRRNPP